MKTLSFYLRLILPLFLLLGSGFAGAHAIEPQNTCLELEGLYALDIKEIKKTKASEPIQADQLTPGSCQFKTEAATPLNPSLKRQSKLPDAVPVVVQNYSYVFKKKSNSNCEYYVVTSSQLMNLNFVKYQFLSGKDLADSASADLDLNFYFKTSEKSFATNPAGDIQKSDAISPGKIYYERDFNDFIEQQPNGNLFVYKKTKLSAVIYALPVFVTKESACLFKKLQ